MKKLLFIHIPKTAGTSIWNWLKDNGHENWARVSRVHHESISEMRLLNNTRNTYSFAVVRNPYDRAISYFHHSQRFTRGHWKNLEHFLETIIEPNGWGHQTNTPYIIFDQSHYVTRNGKIDVDKIYRFENLEEFEKDFNTKIGHDMVGRYEPRELTATEKSLVEQAYARDFELFY